jgi:2-phosphosulfolactate phosphatase
MKPILTTKSTKGTKAIVKIDADNHMIQQRLNVHFLPQEVKEQDLAGSTVIVVDLLRATTTICCAIAAGASEVVPFRTIEETLAAAEKAGRDRVVLGGERSGGRIDGFDLGNSPSEYTPQAVGGRPVYITTTNGTRALHHARYARRVIVGTCLNLSAVVASIKDEARVDVLCAGTNGVETDEDILAAGGLVHELCYLDGAVATESITEAAAMAGAKWSLLKAKAQVAGRTLSEQLAISLRDTQGGRNLLGIGLDQDLVDCARIDRLSIVPELDVRAWRIRLAQ